MKRQRQSTVFVDFQRRSREFEVGDYVIALHSKVEDAGRVAAVWPAIGMLDVTFPMGSIRLPVEEVVKLDKEKVWITPPRADSIPGGAGSVSVPGGPYPPRKQATQSPPKDRSIMVDRVARAYVKKALYWHSPDRKYRATKVEQQDGHFICPRCVDVPLKPAIYKRDGGKSVRLLGCPSCMFLIKQLDVMGHPEWCG